MSGVGKFASQQAKQKFELDELATSRQSQMATRMRELLDNPSERDEGIIAQAIGEIAEKLAVTRGPDAAAQAIQQYGEYFDETWETIHRIPVDVRGELWIEGRKLILAVARRQAWIESGLAIETLENAAATADKLKTSAVQLTQQEKKALAGGARIRQELELVKQQNGR